MASITFDVDGTDKTLTLHKWRIWRRSVRSRHNYRNGGSSSSYRATRLFVSLEWQHLTTAEYNILVAVINGIRDGSTVKLESTDGLNYFSDTCLGTGKTVDLESEDLPESEGEFVEFMPASVDFVVSEGMGLTNIT